MKHPLENLQKGADQIGHDGAEQLSNIMAFGALLKAAI